MTIITPGVVPPPVPLELSNVTVDYDAIDGSLQADLQRQRSWSTLLSAATGSALRRWVSSAITFMAGGVARALQEVYPDTARTPGGVLRAQRLFQGSSILRRRAGLVQTTCSRTDSSAAPLTIPPLTAWTVGGVYFYNLDALVVPGAGSLQPVLYCGTLVSTVLSTDGTPFQRFVVGTPGLWDIGADGVTGTDAEGTSWTPITTGLWQYEGDDVVFRASTLPDGTLEIFFGMGEDYGAIPPVGNFTLTYMSVPTYASTLNGPPLGSAVLPADTTAYPLTGTTTSAASPSQDEPPPGFYKAMGPGQASNNGRTVSYADYRAEALKYDGVIDAVIRGQRAINPSDVRWMNILAVTLLTTSPWSSAQWLTFKAYFEEVVGISNAYCIRIDPTPVMIPVQMTVGSTTIADNVDLTTTVEGVVADYFTPRAGLLGMTVYPSDLVLRSVEKATYQQAPNEAGELIDYVDCTQPRGPVLLDAISYPVAGTVSVSVVRSTRGSSNESTGPVLGIHGP